MSPPPVERTVHLVGSIRLPHEDPDPLRTPPTAEDVFRTISTELPGRLKRLPDGETHGRYNFAGFQELCFFRSPWILMEWKQKSMGIDTLPESMQDYPTKDRPIELGPTGYDFHAVKSYESFKKLKQQGVIEPHVRFMVGIPTSLTGMIFHVDHQYRKTVEPMYEEALFLALRAMQAQIPASELAIQFDVPSEMFIIEERRGMPEPVKSWAAPWFDGPYMPQVVGRFARMAAEVQPGVELGMHLCYGDIGHQHVMQPLDTAFMTEFTNAVVKAVPRKIDFVHVPVCKRWTGTKQLEPLKNLAMDADTDLILGLVHAHDLEGTKARIESARKVLGDGRRFGVATECGWGRTSPADVPAILEISTAVTQA